MKARICILTQRRKSMWSKAHWFFDAGEPRGVVVRAACGFEANSGMLMAPTASYYLKAIDIGWCKKCRRWMKMHWDEVMACERIMEGL